MRTLPFAVCFVALLPRGAAAQHQHAPSPYAGTQSAELPTLTEAEVRQLRDGDGMGLARPAELNHFPGPKHALELSDAMGLTPDQRARISDIRDKMLAGAVAKGEEILEVEGHLAESFASGSADESTVRRMTAHLGTLRGELQAIHLVAHLETRALLTPEQLSRYDELRGYAQDGG